MDALDAYQTEIDRQEVRIDAIDAVYEEVKEQRQEAWKEYRETVVGALEQLQEDIDEPIPLLAVEGRGRMSFDYREVLTPAGVVTEGDGYHDWDGAVEVDTYLDTIYRGTSDHVDRLADRLANLEDEPPSIRYPING